MLTQHPEPTTIDLGDRLAPLDVRVNRRAKRLILRVDQVRGRAIVTAPSRRAVPEAIAFARSRADWVRAELARRPGPIPFAPGAIVPYRGTAHRIVFEPSSRSGVRRLPAESADTLARLSVGGAPEYVNRRVADWMRAEARAALTVAADDFAARLGVRRGPLSVRDTKTRWGSCSADGALSFSWRLILAPSFILDYVAAHECAHLVHMDHSPEFWRTVATLGPDAAAARRWFHRHGARLHAYGAPGETTA